MRTPEEFILELEQRAQGYYRAWLIVTFEDGKDNIEIEATDNDRLSKLTKLMAQGGQPIGVSGLFSSIHSASKAWRN